MKVRELLSLLMRLNPEAEVMRPASYNNKEGPYYCGEPLEEVKAAFYDDDRQYNVIIY